MQHPYRIDTKTCGQKLFDIEYQQRKFKEENSVKDGIRKSLAGHKLKAGETKTKTTKTVKWNKDSTLIAQQRSNTEQKLLEMSMF